MFLSKKIAKLQKFREAHSEKPKSFSHQEDCPSTQKTFASKTLEPKKKLQKLRFQQIPPHSKYVSNEPVFALHGDWPIIVKDNQLVTELSLFNEYKTFQNITVTEQYGQKLVQIKPNVRKEKQLNSMNQVIDLFSSDENSQQTPWSKTFKNYYLTYDKVMKRQSRKKTKSDTRKKFYTKVDANTEAKTTELFENSPVFQLKFRLRNHHSQLYEIVFGEKFVEELGHDIDSFVSSVFEEGLPQIMPIDNPCSTLMMKSLIENYFTVEEKGYEISDQTSTLFMKNGLAKDIKYNVNFLMNYETNSFGMDVLFSIKAQGEPYLRTPKQQETEINGLFVQDMSQRKEEATYFLSEYYSSTSASEISEESVSLFLKEESSVHEMKIKTEDEYCLKGIKFEEEGDSERVKSEEF